MKVNDRIQHYKHGYGRVLKLFPDTNRANVRFDDNHFKTVLVEKCTVIEATPTLPLMCGLCGCTHVDTYGDPIAI